MAEMCPPQGGPWGADTCEKNEKLEKYYFLEYYFWSFFLSTMWAVQDVANMDEGWQVERRTVVVEVECPDGERLVDVDISARFACSADNARFSTV